MMSACHRQLDEMFLLHQELLLQAELVAAMTVLGSYWKCHECHMNFEDEILLPRYARLENEGRWNATLYQQEHQKIVDIFEKTQQDLAQLIDQNLDKRQLNRNIIALLDRQKTFKGLCEHHQEREEISLFVELDRQTDANWRQEELASFAEQWQQLLATEMLTVNKFFEPFE